MSFIDARMVYDSDGKNISNKIGLLNDSINENEQGIGNLTNQINYNPNLLFNPSFSLGTLGWNGIGSNGFVSQFGGYGEGSMLHNSTSNNTSSSIVVGDSYNIPVVANQSLTLSVDMFAGGVTSGSIGVNCNFYDSSNNNVGSGITILATNGEGWKRYSATGTVPENVDHAVIHCFINPNTTNTNASWRKIKLESGNAATIYSDDNTLNTQQYGQQLFPYQLGGSGYQKLPSGWMVQWGYASSIPNGGQVNFPLTFPQSCVIVIPITYGSTPTDLSVLANITSSNFHIGASATSSILYYAIGY